ncbi:uncharacterized protein METZ01_LOCUS54559 [marine metagenome]|uniref:Uncharacterized protein n=1 Tax=marine metagenome TaxID=408172 RepID=A0A381SC90_9ZZZZ
MNKIKARPSRPDLLIEAQPSKYGIQGLKKPSFTAIKKTIFPEKIARIPIKQGRAQSFMVF